jgi:hypothetical protein
MTLFVQSLYDTIGMGQQLTRIASGTHATSSYLDHAQNIACIAVLLYTVPLQRMGIKLLQPILTLGLLHLSLISFQI